MYSLECLGQSLSLGLCTSPTWNRLEEGNAGVLVTCLSPPVAEGDASLQGGSASWSTPGHAFVHPGLSHAHSHRGTAVQRRPWSLTTSNGPCTSLLLSTFPNTDNRMYGTHNHSETLLPPIHLVNCSILAHTSLDHSFSQVTVKNLQLTLDQHGG